MIIGIGQRLRSAREARGLSLDEIEAATRIHRRYLEALEAEAFDQLPAPAYARAFLRSYASYLGLPAEDLLDLHPELRSGPIVAERSPVDVRLTPGTPQSRARRIITAIAVVVAIGVLFLVYTLYGQLRQFASTPPAGSPAGTSPSASAPGAPRGASGSQGPGQPSSSGGGPPVVTQTSPGAPQGSRPAGSPQAPGAQGAAVTPTAVPPGPGTKPAPPGSPSAAQEGGTTGALPAPPTPTAVPPPKPAAPPGPPQAAPPPSPAAPAPPASTPAREALPAGPIQVSVEATDRSWIRTVADGVTVFEGFVNSGDRQVWQARRELSIRVGNAAAVIVSVNGRSLGRLGMPGQVVDRTFATVAP